MTDTAPTYTAWTDRFPGGIYQSHKARPWAYRTVSPAVMDGADPDEKLNASRSLGEALDEIAGMSRSVTGRRQAPAGNNFRLVNIVAVNVRRRFRAPASRIAGDQNAWYAGTEVPQRVVALGVELQERFSSDSWRDSFRRALDIVVDEMTTAGGVNLDNVAQDLEQIEAAFGRTGLSIPDADQTRLLEGWWNWGRWTDTPILPHTDHIHVFTDAEVLRSIETHCNLAECQTWPGSADAGQHAISFAAVHDWSERLYGALGPRAMWANRLWEVGAEAIKITGRMEPAKVTRNVLRKNLRELRLEVNERARKGGLDRFEQEEMIAELDYAERAYSTGQVPPTIAGATITVAFAGAGLDWEQLSDQTGLSLKPIDWRQSEAHTELQLASPLVVNPHRHDLPTTAVAFSGINAVSRVGDESGAMLGFSEKDRQPIFVSPDAASSVDAAPLMAIIGATGSGKSLLGSWLFRQWALLGRPGIFINPKTGDNSFDDAVRAIGGQIYSLDNLAAADGAFDAFRFADRDAAPQLALMYLLTTLAWGDAAERGKVEAKLMIALQYGAEHGAGTTWQALTMANQAGKLPDEILAVVGEGIEGFPLFRLGCGVSPQGESLRVTNNLTLINAGNVHLEYPGDNVPVEHWNAIQRLSVAALRLMVYGSGYALSGRGGFVGFDEFWNFLKGDGKVEVERLGRLARSWNVLPVGLSQRASDFVNIGLENYISRVIGLPVGQRDEAVALLKMVGKEPTPERVERLLLPKDPKGLDWNGMHALVDPVTREVRRGTVAWFRDLGGQATTVECRIPEFFVRESSSNVIDRRDREAAKAAPTSTTI